MSLYYFADCSTIIPLEYNIIIKWYRGVKSSCSMLILHKVLNSSAGYVRRQNGFSNSGSQVMTRGMAYVHYYLVTPHLPRPNHPVAHMGCQWGVLVQYPTQAGLKQDSGEMTVETWNEIKQICLNANFQVACHRIMGTHKNTMCSPFDWSIH